MKFTNGFWLLRSGVSLFPAVQLQKVEAKEHSVMLLFATRKVEHRGQTLNSGLITVELTSPSPSVIGVRFWHHSGGKSPIGFPINQNPQPLSVTEEPNLLRVIAADTELQINPQNFAMRWYFKGELKTEQSARGLFYALFEGNTYVAARIGLGVGELSYGLGERFGALIKNGQSIESFNEDGGTQSDQAYKSIPFYLTNRHYGIFVNHSGRVSFEVGSETVNQVQFSVQGEELQYFFIPGLDSKEVLSRYTDLTGKPALPAAWTFGLWLSTSFVTDYDEASVTKFIDEMERRDIPLSVFHFDCFWMREYQWCDFEWDPKVFPDPAAMLSRLKSRGLRISLWINPYIGQASKLFDEAKELGYLLKRADGSVWQWDLWQAGNAIVDFTNPAARAWYQSKLEPLIDMGVDCFKTDFGERIPLDVRYFDGSDPEQAHNLYTFWYNQTVFELLQRKKGKDAVVFARSATAGSQQMPVHWGGDNSSNFDSMAETLRGGLSLGVSGFGFWSHDIGGFEGTPNPDVFKRWLAFGLLSSHSRLHGNESVRVPWSVDEESVNVTRFFVNLKATLMPYLYSESVECSRSGMPLLRPTFMEFGSDPTTWYLDRQYLLGKHLLVAPVMQASGEVEFYLPMGEWVNFFSGEVVQGGIWRKEKHGYLSLPLYVRSGAVLPLGDSNQGFDVDFTQGTTLKAFGPAKAQTIKVFSEQNPSGKDFQYQPTN
ncbi:MAG: alpha-xylosidase [Actinobacteria bacterium]|nr:alpha-xylosidase [Actinomycetota bacterium]